MKYKTFEHYHVANMVVISPCGKPSTKTCSRDICLLNLQVNYDLRYVDKDSLCSHTLSNMIALLF